MSSFLLAFGQQTQRSEPILTDKYWEEVRGRRTIMSEDRQNNSFSMQIERRILLENVNDIFVLASSISVSGLSIFSFIGLILGLNIKISPFMFIVFINWDQVFIIGHKTIWSENCYNDNSHENQIIKLATRHLNVTELQLMVSFSVGKERP